LPKFNLCEDFHISPKTNSVCPVGVFVPAKCKTRRFRLHSLICFPASRRRDPDKIKRLALCRPFLRQHLGNRGDGKRWQKGRPNSRPPETTSPVPAKDDIRYGTDGTNCFHGGGPTKTSTKGVDRPSATADSTIDRARFSTTYRNRGLWRYLRQRWRSAPPKEFLIEI
jgi:hypothetical protein